MNYMKTTVLLAALTGLLVIIGNYMGGPNGALMALAFGGLINFISYWYSDKIVLAMYRAQQAGPQDAPALYRIVERLAQRNNMPMPKVYVIANQSPNAFATGRSPSHASVAATTGILQLLSEDELEGVMAHELAHVKNRDTLISTVAATIAGAITWMAHMARWAAMFGGMGGRDRDQRGGGGMELLFMAILAPIAAMVIQLAISRSREYAADETGARLCGKPRSLASALARLQQAARMIPLRGAQPSTSHLFIVNPMVGGIGSLFSTHPPMEERIRRLEALARQMP